MKTTGIVTGIVSNLVTVAVDGPVAENEICFIDLAGVKMMAEVIKVNGRFASVQVFESTRGLRNGDKVEFEGRMLEATLGPGLLSSVYDGLQNDLTTMENVFLQRGEYTDPLDREKLWEFAPLAAPGDKVIAADWLGEVKEGWLPHKIMVPFSFKGEFTVKSVKPAGSYNVDTVIAVLENAEGEDVPVTMTQKWPVKVAIRGYREKPPHRRRRHRLHPGPVRLRQDRPPARHRQAGRRRRHRHGGLRRTRQRGRGDLHRVPGTHRPAYGPPPDGTHDHHLQHLQHAGRRP